MTKNITTLTYYTFEKKGKLLYCGEDGDAYHLPLFTNHRDAFEYASRYNVDFETLISVELRVCLNNT